MALASAGLHRLWAPVLKEATMHQRRDDQAERVLLFIQGLIEANASIDGDVLEIGKDTWAIHGVIPYDGELPMAVFVTYDEAKQLLDDVRLATRPGPSSRWSANTPPWTA